MSEHFFTDNGVMSLLKENPDHWIVRMNGNGKIYYVFRQSVYQKMIGSNTLPQDCIPFVFKQMELIAVKEMPKEKTYPKGTTKEQWDQYELDLKNHNAFQDYKQSFADDIFLLIEQHGIEKAKEKIRDAIHQARFMDRPNEPGYYIANND